MYPQSISLICVSVIFPFLASLAVVLRIWARRLTVNGFNASDYTIFLTLVIARSGVPFPDQAANLYLGHSDRARDPEYRRCYHGWSRGSSWVVTPFEGAHLPKSRHLSRYLGLLLLRRLFRSPLLHNSSRSSPSSWSKSPLFSSIGRYLQRPYFEE